MYTQYNIYFTLDYSVSTLEHYLTSL